MSFNRPSYIDAEKYKDSNIFWKQVKGNKEFQNVNYNFKTLIHNWGTI